LAIDRQLAVGRWQLAVGNRSTVGSWQLDSWQLTVERLAVGQLAIDRQLAGGTVAVAVDRCQQWQVGSVNSSDKREFFLKNGYLKMSAFKKKKKKST
jgi:hypothetical protein